MTALIITAWESMKPSNMLRDKMENYIFHKIKQAIKVKMPKNFRNLEKLCMDWHLKLDIRKLSPLLMINKKNKSMNMSKKDKLKRSFNRKRICLLIKDFLDLGVIQIISIKRFIIICIQNQFKKLNFLLYITICKKDLLPSFRISLKKILLN